jgi:hypothetical protein
MARNTRSTWHDNLFGPAIQGFLLEEFCAKRNFIYAEGVQASQWPDPA